MIRTFASGGTDVSHVMPVDLKKALWIDVTDPTGDEIRQVSDELNIPLDDILDALDPDERPRFEDEDDYFLLMYRMPMIEGQRSGVYITAPVGFFVRKKKLVTVHTSQVDLMSYFSQRKRRREIKSSYEILVAILGSNVRRLDLFLRQVQHKLTGFRSTIVKSMKEEAAQEAYQLSNDLIFFDASIFGNLNAVTQMIRHRTKEFPKTLMERLEDIEIDTKQQHDTAYMYKEMLSTTLEAYQSSISNNLNLVLKILASISLILMLPTLIASLYGMNVGLPLENNPYAFWIIAVISACWAAVLIYLFRKLDWL
jgi:magnesium transporter